MEELDRRWYRLGLQERNYYMDRLGYYFFIKHPELLSMEAMEAGLGVYGVGMEYLRRGDLTFKRGEKPKKL